jgi:hypothetical protein
LLISCNFGCRIRGFAGEILATPMVNVLVLALAAAISPTILAVVIVILHSPRPRRLLGAAIRGRSGCSSGAPRRSPSPSGWR